MILRREPRLTGALSSGRSEKMNRITPFLWFDHQAEEAAKFYTSVFPAA
jgi:hypothetical protein